MYMYFVGVIFLQKKKIVLINKIDSSVTISKGFYDNVRV